MENIKNIEIRKLTAEVTEYINRKLLFDSKETVFKKIKMFIRNRYNRNFCLEMEPSSINNILHFHIYFGDDIRFHISIASGINE